MVFSLCELENCFDAISFTKPSNLIEMKAWYHVWLKSDYNSISIIDYFKYLDISIKKIESFNKKMAKGYSLAENSQCLSYSRNNETSIMFILDFIYYKSDNTL
jgi:hypothetical protein